MPIAALIALCLALLPSAASAAGGSGEIEGTVTNSSSVGLNDIEVCALERQLEYGEIYYEEVSCSLTKSTGKYVLKGLPAGEYDVEFYARGLPSYVTQYYDDKSSLAEAEEVDVVEGAATPGIDATMVEAGSIEGKVTGAGGQGLEGAYLCALEDGSSGLEAVECTVSEAGGNYAITKLATGKYEVGFAFLAMEGGNAYISPEYYENALLFDDATPVNVEAPLDTVGIDMTLQVGGLISGTVTNASIEKEPVEGMLVCAIPTGPSEQTEICAETNSSGAYAIPGLASGTYKVDFTGIVCGQQSCEKPYVEQFYDGQAEYAAAQSLAVTAPNTVPGIDASMVERSPKPPAALQPPTLSGSATVGSTLTCSQGSWANNPTSVFYAWLRNGTAIAGQVGSTYTLQNEDGGTAIACQVTATNAAGAVVATSGSVQVSIQTPEKSKANTEGKANTVPPRKGVAVVSTIKRGSNGDLSVALRCKRDGACKGTLKVFYKTVGRVYGSKHQVRRFMHVVLLGSVKFSLSAGGHRTLKLHLTRKGKALLGARMQHSLKLSVSGSDVRSRKLVLKA